MTPTDPRKGDPTKWGMWDLREIQQLQGEPSRIRTVLVAAAVLFVLAGIVAVGLVVWFKMHEGGR